MRPTIFMLTALLPAIAVADAQAQTSKTVTASQMPLKMARGQGAASALVLDVALRLYGSDGRLGSYSGDSDTQKVDSYVWANESLCGMGASDTVPTNSPWIAWHITGNVDSTAGSLMVVRLNWQRIIDKGERLTNGPSGSRTVTIRNGERLELDRIVATSAGSCGASEGRLEASVGTRGAFLIGAAADRLATAYQGAMAGRGAGRGTGFGTGTAQGQQGQTQQGQGQQGQRGLQGQTGQQGQQGGRGQQGQRGLAFDTFQTFYGQALGSFAAELWLVHRKPDGTESVQQQTTRLGGIAWNFSFPPIVVSTSRGAITLDITGKLQVTSAGAQAAPDGSKTLTYYFNRTDAANVQGRRIQISINRRARASGTPLLDISGGSSIMIDVPKPEDVLSFEFPALQKSTEDLLKGHVFSIRLKLAPVTK